MTLKPKKTSRPLRTRFTRLPHACRARAPVHSLSQMRRKSPPTTVRACSVKLKTIILQLPALGRSLTQSIEERSFLGAGLLFRLTLGLSEEAVLVACARDVSAGICGSGLYAKGVVCFCLGVPFKLDVRRCLGLFRSFRQKLN